MPAACTVAGAIPMALTTASARKPGNILCFIETSLIITKMLCNCYKSNNNMISEGMKQGTSGIPKARQTDGSTSAV
jgi:hypothetical protein